MAMLASNSRLFYKRGDPWVSPRQQVEDFGRSSIDNPEFDQYFAKKAEPKEPFVETLPPGGKTNTPQRRMANLLQSSRTVERHQGVIKCRDNAHKPLSESEALSLHDELRARQARIRNENGCFLYVQYKDGTEEEPEYETEKKARMAFNFKMKHAERKGIIALELWPMKTGECELRWSAKPSKGKGNGK